MDFRDFETPIGWLRAETDGNSLLSLTLKKEDSVYSGKNAIFDELAEWLETYFSGEKPENRIPLAPLGSPFRQRVWNLLREIPYGHVRTYGEIANEIACQQSMRKMSAQAIGGAVGHNPILLLIPCHRVIAAHGKLGGFGAGIERKRSLLRLENPRLELL